MGEPNSEQDEETQAFWAWYRSSATKQDGLTGSSHSIPRHFIPFSTVRQYLGSPGRVEALLKSIFPNETDVTIDANVIRQHYLRTLAILVLLWKGPLIQHFVQYRNLNDDHLPYHSRPDDFPDSSDPAFFEHFSKKQWQFCAIDLEYNMHVRLHEEEILPIFRKKKIGQGGNAVIYRVDVHEEYNSLVPHRYEMPERPPKFRHTFVLKTYRGLDAKEQHDAEREAFLRLRYNREPSPFIIAYYGSFLDDETWNIILEYADRGNLDDFMKSTPQPTTGEDMMEYWDRLCKITHGLAHIHGIEGSGNAGSSVLLGWHQDIKPANILVFSGSGTSTYDVYFKIADLSLCHFKYMDSVNDEVTDFDAFGTRAYGAPETFRSDDDGTYFAVQIRRDVDVWSMGCVFSEAAVWARFGWERVCGYRDLRQDEIKSSTDLAGDYRFHDGRYVLQAVRDMHTEIAVKSRDMDHVTKEILQMLDQDMLLSEDKPRYPAKGVFQKSGSIIKQCRKSAKSATSQVPPEREGDHEITNNDFEGSPKTPNNVPPGYIRGSSPTAWRTTSSPVETISSARPVSLNTARSYSPIVRGVATSRQHFYSTSESESISQRSDSSSFGPFRSQSFDWHGMPEPPSPGSIKSHESPLGEFTGLSIDTRVHSTPEGYQRPHRETIGGEPNKSGKLAANGNVLRRYQTEKLTSRNHQSNGLETSGPRSAMQKPQPSASEPKSSNDSHLCISSPEARIEAEAPTPIHAIQEEPSRPHISLEEALRWKEKKKEGCRRLLPGHENLTYLDQRDHIFIVDNSGSMQSYRNDVESVVSLLSYMLKDTDDDGLDLFFTQSTERRNSGRATKLSEVVSRVTFTGMSDMRTRLSQILQGYKSKFGTTTSSSRSWYKRLGTLEPQKPLSFYVLTDGKWQPNEVGPIILAFVEAMREFKLHKDHVGIQFIRFGHDPLGMARLSHLDHGLGLKDSDMDIVDTTPWDGNVWKQLVGAISSWYDQDPD